MARTTKRGSRKSVSSRAVGQSEAELRAVYDNSPNLIALVDRERRVQRVNRLGVIFTGRPEVELAGMRLGEALLCLHSLDDPLGCGFGNHCQDCEVRKTIEATIDRWMVQFQVECPMNLKRGEASLDAHFLLSTVPLRVRTRPLLLATFSDVTENRRLQAELSVKNEELARLNKLKNQLLAIATHDLRNPVSVIQMTADFLLEELAGPLTEKQRKFLTEMRSSSEFMLKLVNDLLDVTRIEAGKLELDLKPVKLDELVRANVQINRRLASRKGIRIRVLARGDLPRLMLDSSRIEQVLNNLIGNAVKYSPVKTRIDVRLSCDRNWAVVEVKDQGYGIPADELNRLFKPFSTTSTAAASGEKSTGLGLMIAREIVESHRGRIEVQSEVGKGSTFRVILPAEWAKP